MKKWSALILTAMLVLSACGKPAMDHSPSHGMEGMDHATSTAEHADHAGHGTKAADTANAGEVSAVFTFDPAHPQAKQDTALSIQISNAKSEPIADFDLNHEKKMHLIAVSKDLAFYRHIHPEYKGGGLFQVPIAFPAGGEYKLFADFVPSGMGNQVKSQAVKVEGEQAAAAALQPDAKLTQTVNGVEASLRIDDLQAGKEVNLVYSFKDANTQKPVSDLQPYLGAVGHVVIIDAKAEQYLHVHPTDEKSTGPEAKFMTAFPSAGIYKIWGEFQRGGQVFTVPFVVKVP